MTVEPIEGQTDQQAAVVAIRAAVDAGIISNTDPLNIEVTHNNSDSTQPATVFTTDIAGEDEEESLHPKTDDESDYESKVDDARKSQFIEKF